MGVFDEVFKEMEERQNEASKHPGCFGDSGMQHCAPQYCDFTKQCKEKAENEKRKRFIGKTRNDFLNVISNINRFYPRYSSAVLTDFSERHRVSVHKKIVSGENFYCYGGAGVGKTHFAIAIYRHLSRIGKEVNFAKSNRILLDIKETFKKDSGDSEFDVIKKYTTPNFLVIDDIGAEKMSEWAATVWYEIIDRRYSLMRPIIFTSNLSPLDLKNTYGERLASRVLSGISYEMKGEDRRLKK